MPFPELISAALPDPTSVAIRRTILVVDDEPRNRVLMSDALSPAYNVLEAESGVVALEILTRSRVDLVLLDVMMPDLNGFDTCRTIKARSTKAFLPVILLTALTGQEERNQGLAAGADEFLSKPVDSRELALRVRGLLKIREQEHRILDQVDELRDNKALINKQLEDLRNLQALKEDLFSLIVHDLRNPLAGIVGFLEVLEGQLADPALADARKSTDHAASAAKKLWHLLDEILEVQKLETEGLPLAKEPVALADLTRDAAATLEGAAKSRGVKIEVEIEGSPSLSIDRSLVRRAFENLIMNAVKFSPSKGTVSATVRSLAGRVVFQVADRGPGVGEATKSKLFKKFGAVEARRDNERRRGFGLGLHLVKLVADAHGGEVFVQDREGGGSVFGMSFPGATR